MKLSLINEVRQEAYVSNVINWIPINVFKRSQHERIFYQLRFLNYFTIAIEAVDRPFVCDIMDLE